MPDPQRHRNSLHFAYECLCDKPKCNELRSLGTLELFYQKLWLHDWSTRGAKAGGDRVNVLPMGQ